MYITLPSTTLFYRVIGPGRSWSDILAGKGAYFGRQHGARYNRSRQTTVYTSTDPLVALTEYAFYEALRWQTTIGQTALLNQQSLIPFSTLPGKRPRLWRFRLDPPPALIDVTDPAAFNTFQHPPYVLLNPSHEFYVPTQDLMDAVFHHPPNLQGVQARGVQAPSVLTPRVSGFQPLQQVFLLAHNQNRLPGHAVESWDLDLEFLDEATQAPATLNTPLVDWRRPRFRLLPRGTAGVLPAFHHRPGAIDHPPNQWHRLEIS